MDESIKQAELALLDACLAKARDVFQKLDTTERVAFLAKARKLAETSSNENCLYNRKLARATRDTAGVTRKELSKLVGLHELTLYKLETGKLPFDEGKEKHKKYLNWLREQGYQTPKN